MDNNFLFALLLTSITGLSTVFGSIVVFFVKKNDFKFFSLMLGFSAGVMFYVSLTALLPESLNLLIQNNSSFLAHTISISTLILGFMVGCLIEKYIDENKIVKSFLSVTDANKKHILKSGVVMAIILTVHNFPEGLSTFISVLSGSKIAFPVAISMALHNIPEGAAIALPVFYITGNKTKAFLYSLFSGFIEPIGALTGYFFLTPLIKNGSIGFIFALIAGIMLFVSFSAIYPTFKQKNKLKQSIQGLLIAFILTAFTFFFF